MGKFTILLPDIGEGIAEAEIAEWYVDEGHTVREDDLIGTVMTDKATVEIPSTVTGRVTWLCGQPGDLIAIGAPYVRLDVEGELGEAERDPETAEFTPLETAEPAERTSLEEAAAVPTPAPAQGLEIEVALPDIGEGIAEAEVSEWHVSVGEEVADEQVLATVMTDKAAVEIPSPESGRVAWLACEPGETLQVGSILIRLATHGAPASGTAPASTTAPDPAHAPKAQARKSFQSSPPQAPLARQNRPEAPRREALRAAPSVRKRATEWGIDLRHVTGTGSGGRILHDDLNIYIENRDNKIQPDNASTRQPRTDSVERKVIGMRRKIAERMALSKSRIPHITIVEEIDVTQLEDTRAGLNARYIETRPKLTILPFLMRAMVIALEEQPNLNAHYDDEVGIVTEHGGVHIGIATQTPNGLTVPVVRHTEARSLWDSAAELKELSGSARDGTISRDNLVGSTVTITSLGPLGAIATTPIINHPEVAIVGVNKMTTRPVWDGTAFQPRQMMNLSCSFDHRVVDGWDAAIFVRRLKELLELPATLFIDG